MGDVLKSAGEQLGFGIADQSADGAVDLEPVSVGRNQGHADGRILKCAGKTLLAFAQRLFGPFAPGDVTKCPDSAVDCSILANDGSRVTIQHRPVLKLNLITGGFIRVSIKMDDF